MMKELQIENKNNLDNNILKEKEQKNFIETTFGKIINAGLNIGLRYLLPDLVEDQLINIKDAIIQSGFKEGGKVAINSAIDIGKSALGIVTGNFENIAQVQTAIKTGGIIDNISSVISSAVDIAVKSGKVSNSIGNIIKKGKNVILSNISNGIEKEFEEELNSLEKINKYSNNWRSYYNNKDFTGMEKEYNKIKEKLRDVVPIENTIREARQIENIHMLIKNNGINFNLTEEQKELVKIL